MILIYPFYITTPYVKTEMERKEKRSASPQMSKWTFLSLYNNFRSLANHQQLPDSWLQRYTPAGRDFEFVASDGSDDPADEQSPHTDDESVDLDASITAGDLQQLDPHDSDDENWPLTVDGWRLTTALCRSATPLQQTTSGKFWYRSIQHNFRRTFVVTRTVDSSGGNYFNRLATLSVSTWPSCSMLKN